MTKKTLILVCGANRSGTTMLDLMLGNADNAFSCGEVYSWFRPTRRNHFVLRCSACAPEPCAIWNGLKDVKENLFHDTIFRKLGVDLVVDSSKNLCWVLDSNTWARRRSIRVVNLVIWKDPVDLAYSFFKRGGTSMEWRDPFVDYYSKFISLGMPFISVSYDELVADPARKLRAVCEAIQIPYFSGKENFWIKKHHHLFGSGGTRKQMVAGNSAIKSTPRSPEFLAVEQSIRDAIQQDSAVHRIIDELSRHEISSLGGLVPDRSAPRNGRPVWYYYRMAKCRLRRYFPAPPVTGSLDHSRRV